MITSCFITRGSSCAALTSSSRIINTPPSPLLLYRILIKTRGKLFQTFSKNFVLKKRRRRRGIENLCFLSRDVERKKEERMGRWETDDARQPVSQSVTQFFPFLRPLWPLCSDVRLPIRRSFSIVPVPPGRYLFPVAARYPLATRLWLLSRSVIESQLRNARCLPVT